MTLLMIFSALTIAVVIVLVWRLRTRKAYAISIALLLPALALVLYAMLGSPTLPGKSFADRTKDPDFMLAAAMKDIQLKLDKSPTREGYKNLAEALYLMQRYAEAAQADQKAIDLGDDSAATRAEMGESLVLANNGTVIPVALNDFYKALKRDPKEVRARFYIALSEAQKGNYRKAVSLWKGLQQDSLQNAPLAGIIEQRIEDYAKKGGFDPASIQASNPSGS